MLSRLPRWLAITLVSLAAIIIIGAIVTGIVFLTQSGLFWVRIIGWALAALIIAVITYFLKKQLPELIKLYKFQKYFKANEAQMSMLPALMQSGRTQEALTRFEGMMKHAPDTAYLFYMRAFFMKAAGKLPEAMSSANKALALADRDPFLQTMLQQAGGQMGQPTTVSEFKVQLEDLRRSLEPRVNQMRERREKAVEKRKKKSR